MGNKSKKTGIEIIKSTGEIIDWGNADPNNCRKVWAQCPKCKDEGKGGRYITRPRPEQTNRTGLCHEHNSKRTGPELSEFRREELEPYRHKSGAWIDPNDRRPGPNHKPGRAYQQAYYCSDCTEFGDDPKADILNGLIDTQGKEYAWPSKFKSKKKWHGLCKKCLEKRGSHRRFSKDIELAFGGYVYGTRRESVDVPVDCILCDESTRERAVAWTVISNALKRYGGLIELPDGRLRTKWPGLCAKHRNDGGAAAGAMKLKMQAELSVQGNEQKNGNTEKRVGGKQRRREQWLLDAVNAVIAIWGRVREYNHLPREKRIGLITQAALADEFGIGNNKTPADAAKQAAFRLTECGVRNMFSGEGSWYEGFRVTVIEGHESGMLPEEIVSNLQSRRAP